MRALSHFTITFALLAGSAAQAQDQATTQDQATVQADIAVVERSMRRLAPNAGSIAVSETPIDGIFQVQIGGDIVYASGDGEYLFQGRVIEIATKADLTENAKAGVRRELMSDIDGTSQITFGPEKPDYELTVFTDIDCWYCRKLHSQVEEYTAQGIAIHYMSFPRAGIGSQSYEKAVSVWCAADPREAMTKAKLGDELVKQQCENPVADQYQLGLDLGVTGTPALLTPDGNLIPGYVPPDKLRERLESMAASVGD